MHILNFAGHPSAVSMFPTTDPAQMKRMMRQFGIEMQELTAKRVIIETPTKTLLIEEPNVAVITMQGKKIFQVMGNVQEKLPAEVEKRENVAEPEKEVTPTDEQKEAEDIQLIMESAHCDRETALRAYRENNRDIAKAIISLLER